MCVPFEAGHPIHSCPAIEEYVETGHLRIVNRCLYLPTGQPILDDRPGLGLKAGVDARSPNQAARLRLT